MGWRSGPKGQESVANGFAASLGDIGDQEFVDLLLANSLDEAPKAAETAFWTSFLAARDDRDEVLLAIAESSEHQTALRELPRAIVMSPEASQRRTVVVCLAGKDVPP